MPFTLRQLVLVDLNRCKEAHMIRLKLPAEPYWLELPMGVRVKVRPLTTAIAAQARAQSSRLLGELRQDLERRKETGVPLDGLPDLADEDVAAGYALQATLQAFARAGIVEWEGVLTADGSGPAPVTPQAVNDLMRIDGLAQAFMTRYGAPQDLLVAEGNASAPAPSGTTAAGEKSATDAASSAPPAPAASAG